MAMPDIAKKSIKKVWRRLRAMGSKPAPIIRYNSYSQAGEDAVLSFLFSDKKISKINYLDLGTNIPDFGNNTFLFYTRGSRGICVEADALLINAIKTKRPEDNVLNLGVNINDNGETVKPFYVFNEPSLNTFDHKEALKREGYGSFKIIRTDNVVLMTIAEIIDKHCSALPDLLSIDIEGLDLQVLEALDLSRYPIPVICAETCTYSENHIRPKDDRIQAHMIANGYFVYADTYINTIFVNHSWFYAS